MAFGSRIDVFWWMSNAAAPSRDGNLAALAVDLEAVDTPRPCPSAQPAPVASMRPLALEATEVGSGEDLEVGEASVVDSAVTVGLVGREPALDTKAAVMDLVLNLRQMHRLALGVAELVGMSEVLIQIDVEAAGLSGMQEVPQAATVNR
jgi:hypothetical protein